MSETKSLIVEILELPAVLRSGSIRDDYYLKSRHFSATHFLFAPYFVVFVQFQLRLARELV